jgi:hypothetical protein
MMKTLQTSVGSIQLTARTEKTPVIRRFFAWCDQQEKYRLAWLGAIVTGHGCVITPLTLGFVMLAGNNFIFWPLAIAAMGMSLITNLAAMPTKVTIPVFFLSLLIDLVIIVNCILLVFGVI